MVSADMANIERCWNYPKVPSKLTADRPSKLTAGKPAKITAGKP